MDWIVEVSDDERANFALHEATAARAQAALREHGCLVLRGTFDPAFIAALYAEFLAQYGALSAAEMEALSAKPPPTPLLKVGEGRYDITPRMTGAFGRTELFANPLLCRFLTLALSGAMRLSGCTLVASYPGAARQHIHRDHPHLFGEADVAANLPAYAISVALPLVDVDAQNGPTGVWPGSHRWNDGAPPAPETAIAVSLRRGDCLMTDYRTLHTGLPNTSAQVRPIAYLVYARPWFFDELNYTTRPSLDMTLEEYEALPADAQSLLTRAFAQAMRLRYLNGNR
ncbi:MAG TPA: phytanoyl-CoA dioxygenase family protein [Rhizomicrobium sp.]|nr:phytanoyl-CoA dioxygenase family protein [Rhizomicrobium sp.]